MKFVHKMVSIGAMLTLMVGMVPAFGAAAQPTLTLNEATGLAIQNSTELAVLQKKVVNAETDLRLAQANVKYYEEKSWSTGAERQANALKAYLTPLEKQHSLNALQREAAATEKQVRIDVMTAYYELIAVQNELEDMRADLSFYSKELVSKQKEFSVGKINQNDLRKYEIKKKTAEQNIRKLENDLANGYMSFNYLIGKTVDSRYALKADLSQALQYTVKDLGALVKANQERGDSVLAQNEDIAERALEIQTLKTYGMSDVFNDTTAQTDLRDKEIDLEKAQKQLLTHLSNVAFSVKSDYNKLLDAYTDIEIAMVDLEIAADDLKVAQAKYKVGLINALDYAAAADAKAKAERSLETLKMNYGVKVETFKKNYELNLNK